MASTRSRKAAGAKPAVAAAGVNGAAAGDLGLDRDVLIEFYRKMATIRLFEEAAQKAFRQGKIGGYLHLYIGQEALATGLLHFYRPQDRIITAYRDHAHALLLGAEPRAVMAELFGKGTGMVKGKGGSMHLFDVENGLWGGYGIVGGHIPLGVGLAYAQAYLKQGYDGAGGITQLYFGDGAIHNGAYHEAANLSALWGREGMNPCLFVLENNQYGMGTSVERATAMTDLSAKFDSYAIPHEDVDANDLFAVLAAGQRVIDRMREDNKPYALEAQTYRLSPHGAADFLERYRSKEEVAEQRKQDPVNRYEQRLLEDGVATEDDLAAIRADAKAVAVDAVKFAEESPEPDLAELHTDVYAD
jgi:pyruvate dehydrogenase E1 component alpha subunit